MDTQKYYYIKLKDNYFEQDNVKILEAVPNGHIYSLILIKMYLKASKHNGQLMMTSTIPYDPANLTVLASVLRHDVAHVKEAIKLGIELDLITILDGHQIWLTEIQNMIGKSSTEADRIRLYRAKLDNSPKLVEPPPPPIKKDPEKAKIQTPEQVKALYLSTLLEELHQSVDSKYKGNVKGWAKDIERLIRIDSRDPEEIENVIRWAKEPSSFWFPNIMSGRKLREKYSQLLTQMNRNIKPKKEEITLESIAKKYQIRS